MLPVTNRDAAELEANVDPRFSTRSSRSGSSQRLLLADHWLNPDPPSS